MEYLPEGGALLDVGCGTGMIATHVELHSDARCLGLDINPGAIARARSLGGADFVVSDLYDVLPGYAGFDIITITVPWEPEQNYPEGAEPRDAYVDDDMVMARALVGAHDYLNPGGHIIVFGFRGMDPILNMAGWQVLERLGDEEGNAVFVCHA